MYIKCWGARGSIPVSGIDYIKYGGDTTCIEIRTKSDDIIIIDAGTGIRRLGSQLLKEGRYQCNFLFTHAHWDHLMGFPFFKPLYREGVEIRMYGCPFPNRYIEQMITKVLTPPNFPVEYEDLNAKFIYEDTCPAEFFIGSVKVIPISLSHPNKGFGYKFIEDKKVFVFITDNELDFRHTGGLEFDDYVKFCQDADLLIHDAEYTAKEYEYTIEWGHSLYITALNLAIKANVKRFGLFHVNQERTDAEMDGIVESCRAKIAEQCFDMECFAVAADMVIEL